MKVVCPKCRDGASLDIKFSDAYRAAIVPSTWTFVCVKCNLTERGYFKFYERITYYFISLSSISIFIYLETVFLSFFPSRMAIIFIAVLTIFTCVFIFWLAYRLYLKYIVLRRIKFD